MEKTQRFLKLINAAIAIAQEYEKGDSTPEWLQNDCHTFIQNMKKLSEYVQSGSGIKSEGAGLGITRFLSENGAPYDLYAAGRAIEVFFKEQMK